MSASIVWVESPEIHRYVRETTIVHPRRRARPGRRWCPGTLVAYSVLPADSQRSERAYQGADWPAEAVDPMRLVAGDLHTS